MPAFSCKAATTILRANPGTARSSIQCAAVAATEREWLATKEAYRRLALQLPLEGSLVNPEVSEARRAAEGHPCVVASLARGGRRYGWHGYASQAPRPALAAPARVVYRVE